MRVAKIKIAFGPSDSYTFPVDDTILTSNFVITNIEGLDPPQVDVSVSDSIYEGGTYQGRRPQGRQIVLTINFAPDYSLGQNTSDLRDQLYDMLTPKLDQNLVFSLLDSSSAVLGYAYGQISNFEAPIFVKDPFAQVTIKCFGAFFVKDRFTLASPGSLSKIPLTISNTGSAPTGFKLSMTVTSNISSLTINNSDLSQSFTVTYAFLTGDIIEFNSHNGQRTITRKRGATSPIRMFPYVGAASKWLQLHRGTNTFTFNTTAFTLTEVSYIPRFWGA